MLSQDILKEIDAFSTQYKSRSEFIEVAVRTFVAQLFRQQQNLRDLEIINRYADDLNEEAMDVLEYQVALWNAVNCIEWQNLRREIRNVSVYSLLSVVKHW